MGLIPVFPPARLAHRPVAIPVANHKSIYYCTAELIRFFEMKLDFQQY